MANFLEGLGRSQALPNATRAIRGTMRDLSTLETQDQNREIQAEEHAQSSEARDIELNKTKSEEFTRNKEAERLSMGWDPQVDPALNWMADEDKADFISMATEKGFIDPSTGMGTQGSRRSAIQDLESDVELFTKFSSLRVSQSATQLNAMYEERAAAGEKGDKEKMAALDKTIQGTIISHNTLVGKVSSGAKSVAVSQAIKKYTKTPSDSGEGSEWDDLVEEYPGLEFIANEAALTGETEELSDYLKAIDLAKTKAKATAGVRSNKVDLGNKVRMYRPDGTYIDLLKGETPNTVLNKKQNLISSYDRAETRIHQSIDRELSKVPNSLVSSADKEVRVEELENQRTSQLQSTKERYQRMAEEFGKGFQYQVFPELDPSYEPPLELTRETAQLFAREAATQLGEEADIEEIKALARQIASDAGYPVGE